MNPIKWLVAGGVIATISYLAWLLTPPEDAVGSYLEGFDSSRRKRKMIRDEDDQSSRLGFKDHNDG